MTATGNDGIRWNCCGTSLSHSEIILQRDLSIPTYVSSNSSCLRFSSRRVVYFKSDLGFVVDSLKINLGWSQFVRCQICSVCKTIEHWSSRSVVLAQWWQSQYELHCTDHADGCVLCTVQKLTFGMVRHRAPRVTISTDLAIAVSGPSGLRELRNVACRLGITVSFVPNSRLWILSSALNEASIRRADS